MKYNIIYHSNNNSKISFFTVMCISKLYSNSVIKNFEVSIEIIMIK